MMFDIVTIGSATKDNYLKSKELRVSHGNKFLTGEGVCMNLGSKIEVDEMILETGGGGTNTAVSFSRFGLKTAVICKIGKDTPGLHIARMLKDEKVSTRFVKVTDRYNTGYSTIISMSTGQRTILVHRGANTNLTEKDIDFKNLKTRWMYIAPLSGDCKELLIKLVTFAKRNSIKVAINPSKLVLKSMPSYVLRNVNLLILNREEASILTGIKYDDEDKIFEKLCNLTSGFVVMTDGKKGAIVCDGYFKYTCNSPKVKVIDTLGAGDAFGAGFTAGMIKTNDVEQAIYLGIMNAVSVIQHYGAKPGLLRLKDVNRCINLLKKIKIKKGKVKL